MSNINSVAVKARLKFRAFGNTRQDDGLTDETKANHGLGDDAGKWTKNKLAPEALAPLRKLRGQIRKAHDTLTNPWETGERLLMVSAKDRYESTMAQWKERDMVAIEELVSAYNQSVEDSKLIHNGTWNADDYPSVSEFRDSFSMEVQIEPLPASSHFLGTLTGEALTSATRAMEATNERRINEAVASTWNRFLGPIKHLVNTLSDPKGTFKDTLVGNVQEIVSLVPVLNVNGSYELVSAAAEISAALAGISAQDLRKDPIVRKATAEAAATVLERFGSMGNRKFAVAA